MDRVRAHLSYANVMATIAVFVALGGTSYAVARNSVGTKQIRNGSVTAADLRKNSVGSSEMKRRAVRLDDISLSARSALRGSTGPAGPAGPPGPAAASLVAAVEAGGRVRSATADPATNHGDGTGLYEVVFDRDLRACYAFATISSFNVPSVTEAGQISTEVSARGVWVRTRNAAGEVADLPFHLMVVC